MIYFDNAATTYYKPQKVKKAISEAVNLYTANAGRGSHKLAQLSAQKIFGVREKLLKFFNAKNHMCIFTSGCTSALNLAILGSAIPGGHIVTTYLEHNSVLRPLQYLKDEGVIDYTVAADIRPEAIEKEIQSNTYMIVTTLASNVTGQRLNITEINKVAKKHNLVHLVDTAQGAGHIFEDISMVDMIAFAGHKGLYGLSGVGGLIVRNGIKLKPIKFGGTGTMSESLIQPDIMPEGFEAGTLANIPIISLGAGIDYVASNQKYIEEKEKLLNGYMRKTLDGLDFITPYYDKNSVGVYSFNVLNYDSGFVSDYLSEKFNICSRSGLHCAPLVHTYFNTTDKGMVRVALSCDNSVAEIDVLKRALLALRDGVGIN